MDFFFLFKFTLDKNPFKKGCVWSRGMFRYQWDGVRILYSPVKWLRNQGQGSPLGLQRITLEFEWTVQGCTLREWRVVRKYGLFTFVFLHVFNFQTNVTIFVWKIYSLNLLLMWLNELLLLHNGSVKIDEYYGMFWALYYSNGRWGRKAISVIHH